MDAKSDKLSTASRILLSKYCEIIKSNFYRLDYKVVTKDSVQRWLRTQHNIDMTIHLNGVAGLDYNGEMIKNYGGYYK